MNSTSPLSFSYERNPSLRKETIGGRLVGVYNAQLKMVNAATPALTRIIAQNTLNSNATPLAPETPANITPPPAEARPEVLEEAGRHSLDGVLNEEAANEDLMAKGRQAVLDAHSAAPKLVSND
jgi:hypothetical protein